jgi:DNA polymerase III epsilon subunit-like protein
MTESPPAARRTTAHNHKQLAIALSWTELQVAKAVQLGAILPPYDLPKTSRWKGPTVDELAARRDEVTAALDETALLTDGEMMQALGMEWPQWRRGCDHGIIPPPDQGAFWSRALASDLASQAALLRERIPPQPLGAGRCITMLRELTGLEVADADFTRLVGEGAIPSVGDYKGWALYDVAVVRQLGTTEDGKAVVTATVTERIAWLEASFTTEEAAEWLDWDPADFTRVADEQGIAPGRFQRWARTDVYRLEADRELTRRVRRARQLGPDRAARWMKIRRTDFDYVVAAGWVAPSGSTTVGVGHGYGRRGEAFKEVTVPLYRVGSLEDALARPGIDWEAVRAAGHGDESPLREYTRLPRARADVVRAFCGRLSLDHSVEVWPHWVNRDDTWEIDWEQDRNGHPTKAEVAEALAAHHGAAPHAGCIVLSTEVGDVIRMARSCLEPGAAVICDFETTDLGGVGIEVAVVDAATGAVLLDTLISPDGIPVEAEARAVHGITDAELAGAPRWREVAPRFLDAVHGKKILAYNASFDSSTTAITHAHAGLPDAQLPPGGQWWCLMEALRVWRRVGRWSRLGGGHRALGDAQAARQVLQLLAAPIDSARPARPGSR